MGFGTPPTVLEGDYSTYTEKWNTAMSQFAEFLNYGFIDVAGERGYLRGYWEDFAILNLDTGAEISDEDLPQKFSSTTQLIDRTVLAKYIVVVEDSTHIRIYKNGTLLQTLTVAGADFEFGVAISYNGQYIIAFDGNNNKVYCFEGS